MIDPEMEQNLIMRYFLRDVPEDVGDRIGERSVVDLDYSEFVRGVELELIEFYLRGKLDRNQRSLFERNYLVTPERREKLATLSAILGEHRTPQGAPARQRGGGREERQTTGAHWFTTTFRRRPIFATLAAVVLIGFSVLEVGLIRQWWRSRDMPLVATGRMSPKLQVLSGRGADSTNELVIRPELAHVTVLLSAPRTNDEYVVEVQKNGQALWRQERVKPTVLNGETVLNITIPAAIFKEESEYVVAWQMSASLGTSVPNTAHYRVKSAH